MPLRPRTDSTPQSQLTTPVSLREPPYLDYFDNPAEGITTWAGVIKALRTLKG
jgi:hypothetical protein